jgi:hypothetical protein
MDTAPGFGGVSGFVDGDRLAGVEGHRIARAAGPAYDVAKRAGQAVVRVQGGLFGPEGAAVAEELPAEEAGGGRGGRMAVEFGRVAVRRGRRAEGRCGPPRARPLPDRG